MMLSYALALVVGYVLGSIPFGFLLTKGAGLGDIRAIGSGNIGATNVLRTGNKKLAAFTLLLDGTKGACAVWIALLLAPEAAPMAAAMALAGHMFPVWLRFRGGKGVATLFGATLALVWPAGLVALLMWLVVALWLRFSSFAALISVASIPVFAAIFGAQDTLPALLVMCAVVIARHHENIVRLFKGTEPKIGDAKKTTSKDM